MPEHGSKDRGENEVFKESRSVITTLLLEGRQKHTRVLLIGAGFLRRGFGKRSISTKGAAWKKIKEKQNIMPGENFPLTVNNLEPKKRKRPRITK